MKSVIIIGGDKRQSVLKKLLSEQGFRCRYIDSGDMCLNDLEIKNDDILILPVPISRDKVNIYTSEGSSLLNLNDILNGLCEKNFIFGGGFSPVIKAYLEEKNISYFDYLDCEEFVLYNAYLTGRGALKLLYENTCEDVRNKNVLVTGFGRVAKYTAFTLKNAECDVYVASRNPLQLTEARCSGYKAFELKSVAGYLYLFDYIFNTVPHNIFSPEDVRHMRGKYFELASAPYGTEKKYFTGKDSNYILGASLPGKYFCNSAAEILAQITMKHINLRNGGD